MAVDAIEVLMSTKSVKLEYDGIVLEFEINTTNIYALVDAVDPLTEAGKLDELSKYEWDKIRKNVANHKNTANETLIRLSKDSNKEVRIAALQNLLRKGEYEIICRIKTVTEPS